MKTKEQIQAALDEIKAVCDKHGVALLGCDTGDGEWSEIYIWDTSRRALLLPQGERLKFNDLYFNSFTGESFVDAIGTLEAKE